MGGGAALSLCWSGKKIISCEKVSFVLELTIGIDFTVLDAALFRRSKNIGISLA